MRTLYILRHSDAEHAPGEEDIDRPLSLLGKDRARKLGAIMGARSMAPAFVLCSPAKRTRQTLSALQNNISPDVPAIYEDSLYLASAGTLHNFVGNVDDRYEAVLLIGHNPGIHELVKFLADKNKTKLLDDLEFGYNPCCLSVFSCSCESWQDLLPAENDLLSTVEP